MSDQKFILSLSCADTRGIVAEVSGYCFGRGCNILHASQFTDRDTDKFFMRVDLATTTLDELRAGFAPISSVRDRGGRAGTARHIPRRCARSPSCAGSPRVLFGGGFTIRAERDPRGRVVALTMATNGYRAFHWRLVPDR